MSDEYATQPSEDLASRQEDAEVEGHVLLDPAEDIANDESRGGEAEDKGEGEGYVRQ